MPISYQIRPAEQRVEIRISGAPTTEEVIAAIDEILAHPEFPPAARVLSDHREVTRAGDLEQVDLVLQRLRPHMLRLRDARWAIVTALPESYGMMRVFSTLAELRNGMEVEVFTDMPSAQRWMRESARVDG